jgi:hypothetical protein
MAGGGGCAGAGYLTCEAAAAERDRLSVPVLGDSRDGVYTVVEWLENWLETRARLRDSTRRVYQGHIRLYFRRLLDGVVPPVFRYTRAGP